jgi:hypothetical protein
MSADRSRSGKMKGPDRFPMNGGLVVRKLIVLCVLAVGASTAWGAGKTKAPRKPPAPKAVVEEAARPDPPPEPKDRTEKAEPKPAKAPKAKVYTFTGLDVEGKLKTPQLLFFLNRVKLELDTTSPEKRSFLKELEKSSDDKGL